MHMADALISPLVGGAMLAAAAGGAVYSARKIQQGPDDQKIPLMGVMGAFVFAAQMINFSIPGTGSSGHLGGGLLLAVLLGPAAGFLTIASILLIQALFFGDGGLLAWGCNVINLGFYTCFIAYPLIFRRLTRRGLTARRLFSGSLLAAIVGLQLGAFSVVLETLLSGKTELPFIPFLLLMQPIHLAVGIVEGLVTAAVLTFIWQTRPDILTDGPDSARLASPTDSTGPTDAVAPAPRLSGRLSRRKFLAVLLAAAVVIGGGLSWLASSDPDGLEWSIERTSGSTETAAATPIHQALAWVQQRTAFLPDYDLKANDPAEASVPQVATDSSWPAVRPGASLSGLVGGALTLLLAVGIGGVASWRKRRRRNKTSA